MLTEHLPMYVTENRHNTWLLKVFLDWGESSSQWSWWTSLSPLLAGHPSLREVIGPCEDDFRYIKIFLLKRVIIFNGVRASPPQNCKELLYKEIQEIHLKSKNLCTILQDALLLLLFQGIRIGQENHFISPSEKKKQNDLKVWKYKKLIQISFPKF